MSLLTKIRGWQIHRGSVALVSAAAGAAATLLIVGVPKMWSAEAAGWASAIGTSAAVVVALWLAVDERRRRYLDAMDQARGVSLLLVMPLSNWADRIEQLVRHLDLNHLVAVDESFESEGGDVLRIPPILENHLERIHIIGSAAVPLSRAVAGAMIAKQMEGSVRAALRGYELDADETLAAFQMHVTSIGTNLREAITRMGNNLHAGRK